MTNQESIIRACTHTSAADYTTSDITLSTGESVHCCCACWNQSVYARRAERKAQLKAHAQSNPCAVPNCKQGVKYTVCGTGLCASHKRKAMKNGERRIMNSGMGAFALFTRINFDRATIIELATM